MFFFYSEYLRKVSCKGVCVSVPLSPVWGWCCGGPMSSCLWCLCRPLAPPAVSLSSTTSQTESGRAASASPGSPEHNTTHRVQSSVSSYSMCVLLSDRPQWFTYYLWIISDSVNINFQLDTNGSLHLRKYQNSLVSLISFLLKPCFLLIVVLSFPLLWEHFVMVK